MCLSAYMKLLSWACEHTPVSQFAWSNKSCNTKKGARFCFSCIKTNNWVNLLNLLVHFSSGSFGMRKKTSLWEQRVWCMSMCVRTILQHFSKTFPFLLICFFQSSAWLSWIVSGGPLVKAMLNHRWVLSLGDFHWWLRESLFDKKGKIAIGFKGSLEEHEELLEQGGKSLGS